MQSFLDLLKSTPEWVYTLVLGAVLGGVAWYVHRRSDKDMTPGSPIIDFLQGAIAGAVALGVLRPDNMLSQVSTALVAGYSASAFLAKQAEALINKTKDDATTALLQTADAVKQANHTSNQQSLMTMVKSGDLAAAARMTPHEEAHEVNLIVTDYLQRIANARSANEIRALQHTATLELKKRIGSAA